MADYDSEISFPCFAGCSGRREDSEVYIVEFTVEVNGKNCVPLFKARHLVEEYHQNKYTQLDSREQLTIHAFEDGVDLADYLLFRWVHEVGEVLHYVLIDRYGDDVLVPKSISKLLYHFDRDALAHFVRHSPYYEGTEQPVEGQVNRVFSTANLPVDLGAFVLLPNGFIRFPEDLIIESGANGQLCLLDDDGAIVNLIYSGSEMLCWGGKLRFSRGVPPLQFVFTANDTGTWEYSYHLGQGWLERKLSDESPVEHNDELPAGFLRCPVCRQWNVLAALECKMCKADLTVPHCKRCGSEIEDDSGPCPRCDDADIAVE